MLARLDRDTGQSGVGEARPRAWSTHSTNSRSISRRRARDRSSSRCTQGIGRPRTSAISSGLSPQKSTSAAQRSEPARRWPGNARDADAVHGDLDRDRAEDRHGRAPAGRGLGGEDVIGRVALLTRSTMNLATRERRADPPARPLAARS